MPYSGISDPKLPTYVKNRSDAIKRKWIAIFNSIYEKEGDSKAFAMANSWLKKQVKQKVMTAKSENHIERVFFTVDESQGFIKRSDGGEEYIDFVLTDNKPDREGVQYPIEVLQKWAEYINSGNAFVGDIDHKQYDEILSMGKNSDETLEMLRKKQGIARGLKAVIDKGRLWVRALIDKRYSKIVRERAKGVSLEAFLVKENDKIVDGKLAGFTFSINDTPWNSRAVIA